MALHPSSALDLEALSWMTDKAQGLDYLHNLTPPVAHRVRSTMSTIEKVPEHDHG
jgi:hypothetical protein